MREPILHITSWAGWAAARSEGEYRADSLADEGFIHCSTRAQVIRVANLWYPGQAELVLLVIEPDRLTAELKWEPPVHPPAGDEVPPLDERFPHLYGPLNLDAVVAVLAFEPGRDGRFSLPASLVG
ncbi:MAG: DUF952 domain-containing protein [Anaerolineales bacterium]|nr:DUF952 domain-containing protein [Anaerolineales bacterium]